MKRNNFDGRISRNGVERDEHDDSEVLITVSTVVLTWSAWAPWPRLQKDINLHIDVGLPDSSGVYEMKYGKREERLVIATASNLRANVQQALVQGEQRHSIVSHMPEREDLAQVEIRWAAVEKYALAEVELLARHLAHFGLLPKYTSFT